MFGLNKSKKVEPHRLTDTLNTQLEQTINKEIIVHKMPKDYKSGNFSYADYFNKPENAGAGGAAISKPDFGQKSNKKTGIIIMAVGIILVGAIAYGAYVYIFHPEQLAFLGIKKTATPTTTPKTTVPKTTTPAIPVITPTTTPTSTPIDLATTTPTTTEPVVVTPVAPVDSDADGLNNNEELAFGTDPAKPDTDNDTYNDLTELIGLYNPNGAGKLVADINNIQKYTNTAFKYEILYPKAWRTEAIDNGSSIILTAADNSFVQVVSTANTKTQTIKDWYTEEFNRAATDGQLTKVGGLDAIWGDGNLTVYVATQTNIYIISYTPISDQSLVYKNVFDVIIKSFTVIK
jgi:hypothetical protein